MGGTFTYANPPVIRWGAGSLAGIGAEIERLGGTRVALVTARSIAENPAIIDDLDARLKPVATALVGQHAPLTAVEAAANAIADADADLVVSVGGGSPIDAAKVAARLVADRRDSERSLPHIAVPTTLSTAEMASGAGVTDEAGNKVGRRDPRMMPDAVIYDASLALHTPLQLWLSGPRRKFVGGHAGFLLPCDA